VYGGLLRNHTSYVRLQRSELVRIQIKLGDYFPVEVLVLVDSV